MPTFIKIYQSASNKHKSKLIKDITNGCDISDSTFQAKKNKLMDGSKNAFSKLEREFIAGYLKKSVKQLFPDN